MKDRLLRVLAYSGIILSLAIQAAPVFAQGPTVGYAVVNADSSGNVPSGNLVFGFVQDSVIVTETAVPSSPAIRSAQLFAEISLPSVNCGIAIANPNGEAANIMLRLADSNNATVVTGFLPPIPANGQTAKMLTEIFPGATFPSLFRGVLTITSNVPVSIITLRLSTNSRGDTVLATLPVVDLTKAPTTGTRTLPQIAAGGGYTTQVILLNPTNSTLAGTLEFYDPSGQPMNVGAQNGTTARYSLPPGGLHFSQYQGSAETVRVGSAILRPDSGNFAPVPTAIFGYRSQNVLITEAAVPSAPNLTRARIYVDVSAFRNTGIAIAAPGEAVTATLRLLRTDGGSSGLQTTTLTVPASGQTARFATELFQSMPNPFRGVLEVTSDTPFSAIALRQTVNIRGDSLLTTFPVASPDLPSQQSLIFPHLVMGGGYQTEMILIGSGDGAGLSLSEPPEKFAAETSGVVIFRLPNGQAMPVWINGFFGTSAAYNVNNNGALSALPNANSPNIVLLTTGLPDARVLAPYQVSLIASGGNAPYTFALLDGELPTGLTLNANGMITGTAALLTGGTTQRISSFHIRVTDAGGLVFNSGLLTITTNFPEITFPLPANLGIAVRGVPYFYAFPAPTGGVPPYHYQLDTAGGFPPFGITVAPAGSLGGVPTQIETRTFRICAVDSIGSNKCPLTTLTIVPPTFLLSVTKTGSGTGTVASSPAGINCGAACATLFNEGQQVTLTAVAATGSTFTGWGGACGGTGACTATLVAARDVTANFTINATANVVVQDVFLGDADSVAIASFKTGDTITINMRINNASSQVVSCTRRYRAIGPNGYVLFDSTFTGDQAAGISLRFTNRVVPSGAPNGTYTLTGTVECNGVESTKTSTFFQSPTASGRVTVVGPVTLQCRLVSVGALCSGTITLNITGTVQRSTLALFMDLGTSGLGGGITVQAGSVPGTVTKTWTNAALATVSCRNGTFQESTTVWDGTLDTNPPVIGTAPTTVVQTCQ